MPQFFAAMGLAMTLWIALSGHFTSLFLTLGALSAAASAWLWRRTRSDARPRGRFRAFHRLPAYLLWFARELILANFKVARIILTPSLPIAPKLISTPARQKSDAARAFFANCITLTPGTVTVETKEGRFLVHALCDETGSRESLANMGDRIAALERGEP